MTTIDPQELAGRYVAVWNEPDAKLRREAIRGLWAEDGTHILGEVVTFTWDMVPAGGGEAAGSGLEILLLGGDGRITADYQFIER
jgi:hypothetical protein